MGRWVAIVAVAGAAVSAPARAQELEEPAEPPLDAPLEEPAEPPLELPPEPPVTVCEGRTVRAIEVDGARRVDADDVRAALSLRRGEVCSDQAVQADARALWALD